ncbi:MAG: amidohydrolase family protein [Bacteroidia bacterium]|nr:amidohydrolase family protein [Bacteroidia bacterium]MCF8426544.1 amidohydrolase family protein [Bacteroidia bacterium]MCF8447183.1 amidohydrolase family protein [Bacteroidia bacterium]
MSIKKLGLILLVFWISIGALSAQTGFPQNGPKDTRPDYVALVHASIQVNPTTLLKDAILLIKNGRIENVGIDIAIPAEARTIDLHGKYVYASFIDLYSRYGIDYKPSNTQRNEYQNNQNGAYAWNDAVKVQVNAADYFDYNEKESKRYLAAGFGATLSGNQDGIFRGSAALVLTGNESAQKLVLKPKAAAGMSFNKGSSRQNYPGSAMGSIALIRQTYYDAAWYLKQKEEISLSFEAFQTLKSLPTVFEAENKLAILRAAKIAQEFQIKYILKGKGDEYQRLDEIAQLGMPLILPLNFPKPYEVENPFDAMRINLADLKHWELAPANAGLVSQKKIPFALTLEGCSDANEFLKNLRKAVYYGLNQSEALKALTTEPAKMIQASADLGTLEKGKIANFFICDKPFFDKESQIEEHWIRGNQEILQEPEIVKLIGNYEASLGLNQKASLQITKKGNKLEGKWMAADTLPISITEKAGIYTLNFKENKSSENLIRASVWVKQQDKNTLQANALEGTAQMPNGSTIPFSAKWVSVQTEKERTDSLPALQLGKIIYPFTEYGTATLPKATTVLFKNATVWTNEKEGILQETDVAISNGKIVAIGKNLSIKADQVVDAKGKQLTSGIIDEHSHIAIYRGVNECTQNNTAEVRIGDVINSDDINIYRQLSGGVIACQQLHGSCNPIGGQSNILKLRWGMAPEQMKIAGSDGFIKFALGENVKQSNHGFPSNRFPQTRMGVEQVYYDAFIRAKEYEKKMKANPALTRKDLEMDALVEIMNKQRFISCHSYVQSEINMLMHVADSMQFKVNTFTHILEGYKVADKMKAHGVNASTFADWWAYKYEVIEAIPQNAVILNNMGVVTAINSDDAEMGRRLNQEAAKMIKYGGLSEEDAWKMVTLNPAKMLHLDAQMGSIKVGKSADLVLWSANPLSIDALAEMTFVDGVCYFSREIDLAKRKEILAERQRIIQMMIAAKKKGEKTEKKISEIDNDYHCDDF